MADQSFQWPFCFLVIEISDTHMRSCRNSVMWPVTYSTNYHFYSKMGKPFYITYTVALRLPCMPSPTNSKIFSLLKKNYNSIVNVHSQAYIKTITLREKTTVFKHSIRFSTVNFYFDTCHSAFRSRKPL